MAQATLEDPMSRAPAPSVAFIIARNGDPLSLALRSGEELDHDSLLLLNEASSSTSTSEESSPTTVFSSREPTIVTKPTSHGTSYPVPDYNGGGKKNVAYPSSLSATHGSGSEAEIDHDDAHDAYLLGTGAWTSSRQTIPPCLRGDRRIRLSKVLPSRTKKPTVVLHQSKRKEASALQEPGLGTTFAPLQIDTDSKCPFHRMPRQHYVVVVLIGLLALTILLSSLSIHYMNSVETSSRKRTVFVATTLVTLETVVAMLVLRRTLLEALLLGFFPLVTGFMFISHHDILF